MLNGVLALFMLLGIGYSAINTELGIFGSVSVSKYKLPVVKRVTGSGDRIAFRSDTYKRKKLLLLVTPSVLLRMSLKNGILEKHKMVMSWHISRKM